MCGIAGATGVQAAAQVARDDLRTLEYRGYDSAGVAWTVGGKMEVRRAVGSVENLVVPAAGSAALGHTRWATHGGVTEANAHPHLDCQGTVAVVHNGVIANHAALRSELISRGHRFASETDSEVLAHLWEAAPGGGLERLRLVVGQLRGTYSVAFLDARTGEIFAAKQRNPLWVALAAGASFLASDPVALRRHAASAIPLEDGDLVHLRAEGMELFDVAGRKAVRPTVDILHLDATTDKAGYEHYMLKEMHETPAVLNRLLARHLLQQAPYVDLGAPEELLQNYHRVLFLGAGTSHHAGLLGGLYLQRLANVPAEAKTSPEYKDDTVVPGPGTLLVAMSQSGETLDTMQALHRLASHSSPLLAFTNHPTSSLGRAADVVVPLRAGTEVSVAATKTFLGQVVAGYLLALDKGRRTHALPDAALAPRARALLQLPRAVERTLLRKPQIATLARALLPFENAFVLAKGYLLPVAMEGALKLKEIAYQHAEAYPAGELKHGPFALLSPQTVVLFLIAPGPTEESMLNSLQEVQSRGAPVLVLAMEGCRTEALPVERTVWLPAVAEELAPVVFAVALHLLSYWVAKGRSLPIDKPRNLAKSVTVE